MKIYLLRNKISGTYLIGYHYWCMDWKKMNESNRLHIFYAEDLENLRLSSSVWRIIKKSIESTLNHNLRSPLKTLHGNPPVSLQAKDIDKFDYEVSILALNLISTKGLKGQWKLFDDFDMDLWGFIFDNLVVEEYDLANPGNVQITPASDYMPIKYKKKYDWWKQQKLQGVSP